MKLLGWMHRKLMQNSMEPIKNPIIGTASSLSMQTQFDEQNYCVEPTTTTRLSKFKASEATNFEESFEPFNFLSIGTFGMELLNTDPPTPTLPVSIDDPMEITKNDLDLINHELEKFLDAQDTELMSHDIASQRSSHASVITLSCYRPSIEGPCSEPCPLQNYLFAASVELVETTDKEAKKERASLGELFKRSSIAEEDSVMKKSCEGMEQQPRKGNVAHFIKKAVKKFHPSSNSTKKKLSKSIVKMFHKKIYPEEMTDKELLKLQSKVRNKSISGEDTHSGLDQIESKGTKKKTVKLSWAGICRGASPENSEYWIKTDSDYLVLEL